MNRDACRMVENLLNDRDLIPDNAPRQDLETVYRSRTRSVQTLFGPIHLTRNYHYHTKAKSGRFPIDEELDLTGAYTPSVARLICRASTQSGSFGQAADDLEVYTGLSLECRGFSRLIHKVAPELRDALATLPSHAELESPLGVGSARLPVMYVASDGTGIPARKEVLAGRSGKQPDGSARTREAKLGCVFTQSSRDGNGEPIRDPDSTSYVGTLEGCREVGTLLRAEAFRRGYARAEKTVYLGDGAPWVWENARLNFPGAVEILDFYHAAEYVSELARAIWGADNEKAGEYQRRWCKKMKESSVEPVVKSARRLAAKRNGQIDDEQRETIETAINYFETNCERMRYGHYRREGYFIGSGVVEAGCKTVIGRRMKQSGMFWSDDGAEDILSLRCLLLGPHFEKAWETRRDILSQKRHKARRWHPEKN